MLNLKWFSKKTALIVQRKFLLIYSRLQDLFVPDFAIYISYIYMCKYGIDKRPRPNLLR